MGEVRGLAVGRLEQPSGSGPWRRVINSCPQNGAGGVGARSNSSPAPSACRQRMCGHLPHGEGTAKKTALRAATCVCASRGEPAASVRSRGGVRERQANAWVASVVDTDNALLPQEAARVYLRYCAPPKPASGEELLEDR